MNRGRGSKLLLMTVLEVTWKVCWGYWGPRLRSGRGYGSHRAAASESRSEAFGFLSESRKHLERLLNPAWMQIRNDLLTDWEQNFSPQRSQRLSAFNPNWQKLFSYYLGKSVNIIQF